MMFLGSRCRSLEDFELGTGHAQPTWEALTGDAPWGWRWSLSPLVNGEYGRNRVGSRLVREIVGEERGCDRFEVRGEGLN